MSVNCDSLSPSSVALTELLPKLIRTLDKLGLAEHISFVAGCSVNDPHDISPDVAKHILESADGIDRSRAIRVGIPVGQYNAKLLTLEGIPLGAFQKCYRDDIGGVAGLNDILLMTYRIFRIV